MCIIRLLLAACFVHAANTAALDLKKDALLKQIHTNSDDAQAHYALGMLYADEEDHDRALHHLRVAAQRNPHNTQALFSLAVTACKCGAMQEAITQYKKLLSTNPSNQILYNLGYTLKTAGFLDEAIDIQQRIIAKEPTNASAHLGLAFAYMNKGDYGKGFKAHRWNLKHQKKYSKELRSLIKNNTLAGKRILLTPEGGLGDSIMFIRYARLLKQHGAIVTVAIQPALHTLFSFCSYIDELIEYPPNIDRQNYDAHSTLMSCAAHFDHDEFSMPKNTPYLYADPELIHLWKEKLSSDKNIKIGLCWQASVHNDASRMPIARRGIPLAKLAILFDLPGITFYSLQTTDGLEQLNEFLPRNNFILPTADFDKKHGSFMDTAALITQLDLVISIDSAVAHLAGALNKPVWTLLPYAPCWRYVYHSEYTPWYPSMRVFKQPVAFDWNSVVIQVYQELKRCIQ